MKKPTAATTAARTAVEELFGEDLWKRIASKLKGGALSWWQVHKDDLVELSREEAAEIFDALKTGDTLTAKMEIVGHMSRKEWIEYRRATSDALQGIAARRHRLLRAIEVLAINTAKILGSAVRSVL